MALLSNAEERRQDGKDGEKNYAASEIPDLGFADSRIRG